ncbi:hypothetical protein RUM43_001057 [Polyplax serrata]|uniref:LIM zinc-binding domain-containing protein n=1 Tax=Polyplax serrata TaxID=468196 RepID=A0AAN8XPL3_POLSC
MGNERGNLQDLEPLIIVWTEAFRANSCRTLLLGLPFPEELANTWTFNLILRSVSAERKTSLGKDWHGGCLRCEKCNKTLVPGGHAEHAGKPYCNNPCYSALFGPGGFGRGGAQSYIYN